MSVSFLKGKEGALRLGMATLLGALAIMVGFSSASAATPQAKGGENAAPQTPAVTCPSGQCFADVAPGNTFYAYINSLYLDSIVSGYACGGAGEPCDGSSRPYYRPGGAVSRGSMSKFVDLARPKAGLTLDAKATNGDYFALAAFRDAPGTGGLDGDAAILAINTGNGLNSTTPSAAVYALGSGATNSVGIHAIGSNDVGGFFDTGTPVNDYGVFIEDGGMRVGNSNTGNNDVVIEGDLIVAGCSGCRPTEIMRNAGTTDLRPGEVVVMNGGMAGPAQENDMPSVAVAQADTAYNTSVVGVAYKRWVPADASAEPRSKAASGHMEAATSIKPGEYVVVITQGSYPAIKVDASNGPIHAGDLLTTSGTPGVAMKVTNKMDAFGAVIGKAMGNLESGSGEIGVLVTLK